MLQLTAGAPREEGAAQPSRRLELSGAGVSRARASDITSSRSRSARRAALSRAQRPFAFSTILRTGLPLAEYGMLQHARVHFHPQSSNRPICTAV